MRKEMKKIFVLVFFLSLLVSLSFVLGASNAPTSIKDNPVLEPIVNMFTAWNQGEIGTTLAKWLLFFIVWILIYSVAEFIPGINSFYDKKGMTWLPWVFSALVAFLSMAPLTKLDIQGMLVAYSALGFVMGGIVPFLVLFFFTVSLAAQTEGESVTVSWSKKIFSWSMWIVFVLFLIYKMILLSPEESFQWSQWNIIAQWMVLIASIGIVVLYDKVVWHKAKESMVKEVLDKYQTKMEESAIVTSEEAKKAEVIAGKRKYTVS